MTSDSPIDLRGAHVWAYALEAPAGYDHERIEIVATGKLENHGQWNPYADVWAVRKLSRCLNVRGEWEWEPLPSSRDDEFLECCRFPLDLALHLAAIAMEQWWETRKETAGV